MCGSRTRNLGEETVHKGTCFPACHTVQPKKKDTCFQVAHSVGGGKWRAAQKMHIKIPYTHTCTHITYFLKYKVFHYNN